MIGYDSFVALRGKFTLPYFVDILMLHLPLVRILYCMDLSHLTLFPLLVAFVLIADAAVPFIAPKVCPTSYQLEEYFVRLIYSLGELFSFNPRMIDAFAVLIQVFDASKWTGTQERQFEEICDVSQGHMCTSSCSQLNII